MRGKGITPGDVRLPLRCAFFADEHAHLTEQESLVKEVLAQLGHRSWISSREVHHRLPTPGPKWVRSANRREIRPYSRTPFMESCRGRSAPTDRHPRNRDGLLQCYLCKGYGHFANVCLSEGFYKRIPDTPYPCPFVALFFCTPPLRKPALAYPSRVHFVPSPSRTYLRPWSGIEPVTFCVAG